MSLLLLLQVASCCSGCCRHFSYWLVQLLQQQRSTSGIQMVCRRPCTHTHANAYTLRYKHTLTHTRTDIAGSEAATEAPTTKFFHILWKLLYAFYKIVDASGKCSRTHMDIQTHTHTAFTAAAALLTRTSTRSTHVQYHKMAVERVLHFLDLTRVLGWKNFFQIVFAATACGQRQRPF